MENSSFSFCKETTDALTNYVLLKISKIKRFFLNIGGEVSSCIKTQELVSLTPKRWDHNG
jgi:ribosome-associated translation inhibitor RaiA